MLELIKESIRTALTPLARKTSEINPNTLTIFGMFMGFVSAILFAWRETLLAGVFLLISGFFDAMDGLVARENNRSTGFGGFLDSVCDRFADAAVLIGAIYGGLTYFPPFPDWFMGVLAIVGSLMVSYTRARAEAADVSASVGIGERSVRMIIIICGAFIGMVNWAVFLVVVLSFITVFQRIIYVHRTLK